MSGAAAARPLVVFGWGNPSRGDDALGPLLLERVEAWAAAQPACGVHCVSDFQLQIEHAMDLEGVAEALFLDADVRCPPPFEWRAVRAARDASHTTHALSPAAVLAVFEQVTGAVAPPARILAVRGESFELGEALSEAAAANLEAAWAALRAVLEAR